jgi:hypothetical protein
MSKTFKINGKNDNNGDIRQEKTLKNVFIQIKAITIPVFCFNYREYLLQEKMTSREFLPVVQS